MSRWDELESYYNPDGVQTFCDRCEFDSYSVLAQNCAVYNILNDDDKTALRGADGKKLDILKPASVGNGGPCLYFQPKA